MAKKKVTQQPLAPKQENPQDIPKTQVMSNHQEQAPVEEPQEKLQSLKSLNSLLVKEAFQRRQQVESLVQAKEDLEAQLSRYNMEKGQVESQLRKMSEERVSLDIEKRVLCACFEVHFVETSTGIDGLVKEKGEKENEIELLKSEVSELIHSLESERNILSQVCQERELMRRDLHNLVQETSGLKNRIIQAEEKERKTEVEFGNLRKQYSALIEQKKEMEKSIEGLISLRDLAEGSLEERLGEIGDLKREMERIVGEKNEVEMEKNGQARKINELDEVVKELNESLLRLQTDGKVMSENILELKKRCSEATVKEKTMTMKIDALEDEKREREETIKKLLEEKDLQESRMNVVNTELKAKSELNQKLLKEKKEIEEEKAGKESEIVQLQHVVDELRDIESAMQESIKDQEDKNKQLASEVRYNSEALAQVRLERDDAQRDLDEEKKNVVSLQLKVQEMDKKIEETKEELVRIVTKCGNLVIEKEKIIDQLGSLNEEKELVQNNLLKAEREVENLSSRVESTVLKSERVLKMLKSTASSVRQSDDGKEAVTVSERKLDDEIESFAAELEVIMNAFRDKETAVVEMRQEVELLQNSVAKARKQNNFWTVVTSATTFFAAAILAYVAKVR
ncbi:hypothetical protein K2173_017659 [Erythroxylum novogranatense]|uniref:Uncharacterized protein n=1 Tax=Erythroxylum novogranatense TaxID=1862640 RepID=A0AAV8T1N9_9ROSI|nr:hypothetical protein K2173_017659 [Erythroxylum novogranatense]